MYRFGLMLLEGSTILITLLHGRSPSRNHCHHHPPSKIPCFLNKTHMNMRSGTLAKAFPVKIMDRFSL
jgi:hypothetical protein